MPRRISPRTAAIQVPTEAAAAAAVAASVTDPTDTHVPSYDNSRHIDIQLGEECQCQHVTRVWMMPY